MKYFTLAPLQGHWGKICGMIIVAISLICLMISMFFSHDLLPGNIPPAKQIPTLLWILGLGSMFIVFSREKIEDERVARIRYTALRATVMFFAVFALCAFSPLVVGDDGISKIAYEPVNHLIMLLLILPLFAYLIIFHIGLYRDPHWAYNDGSVIDNFKEHPRFILYLLIAEGITLVVLILLKTMMN